MYPEEHVQSKSSGKKFLLIAGFILVLIIAVLVAVFGMGGTTVTTTGTSEELSEAEVAEVVAAVGDLLVVPQEEEPIVAKITDASKLQTEQPFYQNAQNGDFLVIYPSIAKAIVYSPSRNKLVNVGPLQVRDTSSNTTQQASVGETADENTESTDSE